MSDVYLDNKRILPMKKVDKELKKIGTWRDMDTDTKIIIFSIVFLLAGSVFVVGYMRKAKEEFKQELVQELQKSQNQTDFVRAAYFDNALSKQR